MEGRLIRLEFSIGGLWLHSFRIGLILEIKTYCRMMRVDFFGSIKSDARCFLGRNLLVGGAVVE